MDPLELSESWALVTDAYTEHPESHVELARFHPAPFCEFVIRNTSSYSPRFGKPIILAPMHVEALQMFHLNDWAWWMKPREHGGSTVVAGFVIWNVGKNPDTRVKCVAGDSSIATKKLSQVDRYFNPGRPEFALMQRVFPGLEADPDYEWSKTQKFLLRDGGGADPTFEACGVMANATAGRADILWMDDVTNRKNAITEPAMKPKVVEAVEDDWLQLLGDGGKAIGLSNYWASDDATQVIRQRAERAAEEGWAKRWAFLAHQIDDNCTSIFPEVWPRERLLAKKANSSARTWARGYACREPTREEMGWKEEWFRFVRYPNRDKFENVVQRVDTATSKKKAAAFNSYAVVGVRMVPKTDVNPAGVHFHVFEVDRWKGKLADRCRWVGRAFYRHNVDDLGVELASDGEDMIDMLEAWLGVTVEPIKQYEGKRERLARHEPIFRHGLITFDPSLDPAAILEVGDEEAPNPVAEILGTTNTHDCADALEMAIRGVMETTLVDLSGLADGIDDETGEGWGPDDIADPVVDEPAASGHADTQAWDGTGAPDDWWDAPTDSGTPPREVAGESTGASEPRRLAHRRRGFSRSRMAR